jgi:hypothetical protein
LLPTIEPPRQRIVGRKLSRGRSSDARVKCVPNTMIIRVGCGKS